jgi:mannitol PTS system EIIA component
MTPRLLSEEKIRLRVACASKWDAIAAAGELLVAAGHVDADYLAQMCARERTGTTYVGNGIAIPHGTREAMALVRSPGIAVLQIPGGVEFGDGQIARLVFGLAAHDGAHLELLSHIAIVCADRAQVETLVRADSARAIMAVLAPGAPMAQM